MKISTAMIHILLSILLFLLLAMSLSVYMRLTPPESVVLVALRMPYQMLSKYLTIAGETGVVLYIAVIRIKGLKPDKFSVVLAAGFGICCILGCIYSLRIQMASAQVSEMQYDKQEQRDVEYEVKKEDLHEKMNAAQCSVATPLGSQYADNCVIYLNYGGWSAQDENMGAYLEKLVTEAGYSYVRFVGIGKEQGNISDIVKDIKEHLKTLMEEKEYKKIVLIGGSAGGNIALITAFSDGLPEVYGESFPVDGVIALYPMTDMESAYEYFVEQANADSVLGTLGDKLYCGLYGNTSGTGTFAGETKVLDESVFGVKGSANSLYHEATVLNLVGDQDIPTLMIGGSADSMVLTEDTGKLYQYMEAKGMDCAYLELPGVEHAFDITDNAARKRACVEMRNWLDTVLSEK